MERQLILTTYAHKMVKPTLDHTIMRDNRLMKEYEIISMEASLGKYWVVTYKLPSGEHESETIEALDSSEAFIKFRNLMIQRAKNTPPK